MDFVTLTKKGSEDDFLPPSKRKLMGFTLEEKKVLLKLVSMHYDIVTDKNITTAALQRKRKAWVAIHKKYSESTGLFHVSRTPQQLKKCWENIKCKAKNGDQISIGLLRWSEALYKLSQKEKNSNNVEKSNKTAELEEPVEDDSYFEVHEDVKPILNGEEFPVVENQAANNGLSELKDSIQNSNCEHCGCEKHEKIVKMELLSLEKQHNEELHQLQMQLVKDRIEREKELHRLHVHEMSLKVENERRRAEILERNLKLEC